MVVCVGGCGSVGHVRFGLSGEVLGLGESLGPWGCGLVRVLVDWVDVGLMGLGILGLVDEVDGTIPESISPSLVKLRLGSNSLNGPISSVTFASLQNLTYLELENNSFTRMIPPEIGSCKKLALMNLAHNKQDRTLLVELGNLTNLQVLELQLNKLDGEIPSQIEVLNMLSILNISWNSLNGTISSSISNCGKLVNLNLQDNDLTGSIPDNIRNLNFLLEL
ncbi:hypothetical protein CRYUN_Cryun30bG0095200 [Craigia yunnanensis]